MSGLLIESRISHLVMGVTNLDRGLSFYRFGAYASAKEAIRGMSWVAALEWGKDNIRISVVCPFTNSDRVLFWAERFPKDYERAVRHIPLRRVGDTHDDIGAVVAFLVSPDSSYLTGQTIHIDGGSGSFR